MSVTHRIARHAWPLHAGQRLDQIDFHERYEAMPPGIKAELIDGVVQMPSPVGREHCRATDAATVWLRYYEERTPGVEALGNASTALGTNDEVQPDVLLRILPELGGLSGNDRGIVTGPPELVVEVAHSTKGFDLGAKLATYERAGVLEYVVRLIEPDEVRWHRSQAGKLVVVPPDPDGWYRSAAFPGLWLDPSALLAHDTRRLRDVVDLGTATPDYATFEARLWAQRR